VALSQQKVENEEMYQELHTKISSRSFNSKVAQALSTIKELVETKLFLNVVEVAKGGSVGKGTAVTDCEDAELVFFVKGLPTEGHKKWLSPLLKSVQSVLQANLSADEAADIELTETSVRVNVRSQITVDLRFSPAFESYSKTVQALGASGPDARKPFEASFVKERTQVRGGADGGEGVRSPLFLTLCVLVRSVSLPPVTRLAWSPRRSTFSALVLRRSCLAPPRFRCPRVSGRRVCLGSVMCGLWSPPLFTRSSWRSSGGT